MPQCLAEPHIISAKQETNRAYQLGSIFIVATDSTIQDGSFLGKFNIKTFHILLRRVLHIKISNI
jgi:hypothetical protein